MRRNAEADLTYRLLVLDLDGTVMGDDQRIRPAVREAVRRAWGCP